MPTIFILCSIKPIYGTMHLNGIENCISLVDFMNQFSFDYDSSRAIV